MVWAAQLRIVGVGAALSWCLGSASAAWDTSTQVVLSQTAVRTVTGSAGNTSAVWRDWANAGLFPSHAPAAPAGSVLSTTRHKGPGPIPGSVIDVEVKRVIPWSSVGKAVAKSLPLISTALAIKDIADAIRCREAAGGGSECDLGRDEVDGVAWCETTNAAQSGLEGIEICAPTTAQLAVQITGVFKIASGYPTGVFPSTSCVVLDASTIRCFNAYGNLDHVYAVQKTALQCPSIVVGGSTIVPAKGPDGKCPSLTYVPASEEQVASRAEQWGDKSKAPAIVGDLLAGGKTVEHAPPELDPLPEAVQAPRETTTHPDGSTTVKDTRYDFQPGPLRYDWSPVTTTKDYPPGATIPPPGAVTDGTTTTGSAPKEDFITCGLPTTPPCKIDETGTPTSGTIPTAQVDSAKGSALDKITDLGNVQAPAWTWSFALPTGCQAMTVGPFAGRSVTVDLCAYQAMIHDLASLIWAAFTVWACVGMVGRTFASG